MAEESAVRALERGLQILSCFTPPVRHQSLGELAERTGLSTSTTSRLLTTLVLQGFLQKDSRKQYSLGQRMYLLTSADESMTDMRQLARPFLEALRDELGETASLYVVSNAMRVCVESVKSTHSLRRSVAIGEILPLTRGAAGLLLLAWQPAAKREALIANSPISAQQLLTIQQQGYVITDGEYETGVFAIAAPILNHLEQCVAAVAVSGPRTRMLQLPRERLIRTLRIAAHGISRMMGYREHLKDQAKAT